MTKNLVYTVAFGNLYRQMATMLVQSIRTHGFGGDIVVFSDVRDPIDGARVEMVMDNLRRDSILNRSNRRLFRNFSGSNRFDYTKARMCLPLFLDISQYRYIWYLDSDILAAGDITPLFYPSDLQAIITIVRKSRSLLKGCGPVLGKDLSPEERRWSRARPKSNAGAVGMPSDLVGGFLDLWLKLYEQYENFPKMLGRKLQNEEFILNYLVASRKVRRCPDPRIGFTAWRRGKLVYHFIGSPKWTVPMMNQYYERLVKPFLPTHAKPATVELPGAAYPGLAR